MKWVIILLFQFYNLLDLNVAQFPRSCGGNETLYSRNGTYDTNLNTLLSSLTGNIDSYGFYNTSRGENPDKVSIIAQCRGDVGLQTCRDCVSNAARDLPEACPYNKVATGYFDECVLRYSNDSIIGTVSSNPLIIVYTKVNASSPDEFMRDVRSLLESLRNEASRGGTKLKFASNNTDGPDFQTIYAFAQCTADLSPQDCFACLGNAYRTLPGCACYGKPSVNMLSPSCYFRYQLDPFLNEQPPPPPQAPPHFLPSSPPPPPPPPGDKDDKTARTVIIIAVPIVSVVILTVCISIFLIKKRGKRKQMDESKSIRTDDISTEESLQYDLSTIRTATDNFSTANKLGQGGFGPVYKGTLPNGLDVAVKRLSANSGQGDLEFKNEVLLVAKLQHRNLVRLLGFCIDGSERLLIYEFLPNASLDQFLFDPIKRRLLDWEIRFKIIGGVARGILYLHEDSRLRIVHRDLKASNVLLDAEMNPKISDFGMARLFTLDETQGNTSRIVGTYGYMAPEYAMHGQFSVKSDVYSFGVLVLEILSGQRNTSFRNGESVEDLLSYAWSNWCEGTPSNLVDPMLRGSSGLARDIMRCIHIALLCVQENVADRPTMATVVLMLSSFSLTLPMPSGPSFSMRNDFSTEVSLIQEHNSRTKADSPTISKSRSVSSSSRNEASITELYPR